MQLTCFFTLSRIVTTSSNIGIKPGEHPRLTPWMQCFKKPLHNRHVLALWLLLRCSTILPFWFPGFFLSSFVGDDLMVGPKPKALWRLSAKSVRTLSGSSPSPLISLKSMDVASAMFRTGMIEAWGCGIEEIVEGCDRIDAPRPVFKQMGGDISIEFFAPESAVLLHEDKTEQKQIATSEKPINREQAIIDYVTAYGEVSNKEARELLGLADSTTKRVLSNIVKEGSLESFEHTDCPNRDDLTALSMILGGIVQIN